MTLESGDRLFFEFSPTGLVVQVLEDCNVKEGDAGREGCDTVTLDGAEAAHLMWALQAAEHGVCLLWDDKTIKRDKLAVGYSAELSPTGGIDDFFVYGKKNTCVLNRYEVHTALCALESQAWRLFK